MLFHAHIKKQTNINLKINETKKNIKLKSRILNC